jgi:response regulator RpfG family c-di-GMP phosphodiesterase
MSATSDKLTERAFSDAGADHLLFKPFDFKDLELVVTNNETMKKLGNNPLLNCNNSINFKPLKDLILKDRDHSNTTNIINLFAKESKKSIELLETALVNQSNIEIVRNAMQLKSIAGHIGAERLAEICEMISRVNDYRNSETRSDLLGYIINERRIVCDLLINTKQFN